LISAQKKFRRLRMDKTSERNAVLIFIAPRAHKFAVVGDTAIHEKCGEQFWQQVIDGMREHFQKENFSRAVVEGIEAVGKLLGTHFPRTAIPSHELPDEIVEG
jgi:Predicted membrane protein